jgi:hypothetical protein
MSFLRPEVAALLTRWREALVAAAVAAAGLWLLAQGGVLASAFGALALAAGAALGVTALRRRRFARPPSGPGVVEIVEGQIGWYGPGIGGFVALSDLSALGLVTVAGLRCWRLVQQDGRLLLIPVDAAGAEALFDAFAALPGLRIAPLLAALDSGADHPRLWHRTAAPALPAPRHPPGGA